MSQEYLFIGGCADGKRLVMPDDLVVVEIPKAPKMPDLVLCLDGDKYGPACECDIYRLYELKSRDRKFYVFAYAGLSSDEAFEKLLECYKP